MSSIKITWEASTELRHTELVATGERTEKTRYVEIDLVPLTPERRNILVTAAAVYSKYAPRDLELRETSFDPKYNYGHKGRYYLRSKSAVYDLEPDISEIINVATRMVDDHSTAEFLRRRVAAEEKGKEKVKKAEIARLTAAYNEALPKIQALIDAGDYEALDKGIGLPGKLYFFTPTYKSSLFKIASEAQRDIAKQRRETEKAEWIQAHGSDHLQRAFANYDCQRLYVQERAEKEAPSFTVDFNDNASWKDRSCPSGPALDLVDQVAELGNTGVVWLTNPAQDQIPDYDDWDGPFEEREAVIVRAYLGKYDLVSN